MNIEINDGERAVILAILSAQNAPGEGPRDFINADSITQVREAVSILTLKTETHSDYYHKAHYEIAEPVARWIDDNMQTQMTKGFVPAALAEFLTSLHDKMQQVLDHAREEQQRVKDRAKEDGKESPKIEEKAVEAR